MVILLIILASVIIYTGGFVITTANLQSLKTNMLLIQAKERTLAEKALFEDDKSILKGEKLSEVNYPSIENLKNLGIISTEEEHYEDYYVWNSSILQEFSIDTKLEEGQYYIVNYNTDEIITTEGFEHKDGNTYYKLSDIKNL